MIYSRKWDDHQTLTQTLPEDFENSHIMATHEKLEMLTTIETKMDLELNIFHPKCMSGREPFFTQLSHSVPQRLLPPHLNQDSSRVENL